MNMHRIRFLGIWLVWGSFVTSFAQQPQLQPLKHAWEVQPNLGDIWVQSRPSRASYIDVEDLASPQIQQRLNAAQWICLNHNREGFLEKRRALELLLLRLAGSDEPVLVRRAMMSAACLLDDGANAKALWEASKSDRETRITVERALIHWKNPVALELWRSTLQNLHSSPSDVALALDGISSVGSDKDQQLLLNVLRSNASTPTNRLLAANAMGTTNTSGLVELAEEVLRSDLEDRQLVAAFLLQNHSNEESLIPLLAILESGSETSKWIAATAVANRFPKNALAFAPEWIQHSDTRRRILALEVLQREPNEDTLKLQASLLADANASVRNAARKNLRFHAENGFRSSVDECIVRQLQVEAWQGLEQSTILIAELQDRTHCNAIIDLLQHPRPEVHMHAGWALMELANEPEVLTQIQSHCEALTERLATGRERLSKAEAIRLSFLLEALGKNRFDPALPMLMTYVPKNEFRMGNISRASAIWSIGQIRADRHDAELRAQLHERMKDLPPQNPENYLVRFACLLALGQFAHPDSIETIETYGGKPPNALGYAAEWALQRIKEANP